MTFAQRKWVSFGIIVCERLFKCEIAGWDGVRVQVKLEAYAIWYQLISLCMCEERQSNRYATRDGAWNHHLQFLFQLTAHTHIHLSYFQLGTGSPYICSKFNANKNIFVIAKFPFSRAAKKKANALWNPAAIASAARNILIQVMCARALALGANGIMRIS